MLKTTNSPSDTLIINQNEDFMSTEDTKQNVIFVLFCSFLLFTHCNCCRLLLFILDSFNVRTALAMVGKFGITASFAVIYIYSAELFPTVLR